MNEDQTFDRLKRLDFPNLESRLSRISDGRYAIVNPMTFEYMVAKPFHSVITSNGWTVDEFNSELNQTLYMHRYNNE